MRRFLAVSCIAVLVLALCAAVSDYIRPNQIRPGSFQSGNYTFDQLNSEQWALSDIQAAINALPSGGGKVHLLPNHTYSITCGVNQITTGTKVVWIDGSGSTSVIEGSGCTLVTLASTSSKLKSVTIRQTTANASTVGVFVGTGTTTEVTDWSLEDVFFESTNKLLGSAIKTQFGLEGTIRGGEARGWKCGVELTAYDSTHRSNGNSFYGFKARWGKTGFCIPAGAVDSLVTIDGAIIEGNDVGIDAASGKVAIAKSHLENMGGTNPEIKLSGTASLDSRANFYGAVTSGTCIEIVTTADNSGSIKSDGDTLNYGVKHDGSGLFEVKSPAFTPSMCGDTAIVYGDAATIISTKNTRDFYIAGFATADFRLPLINKGGDFQLRASTGNKLNVSGADGSNKTAEFDPATKTSTFFGPVLVNGGTMGKAFCKNASGGIGSCTTAVDASGNCTCN